MIFLFKKIDILIIMQKISDKHINYIYHLADIHIRPLSRHDEYRHVFNNLYKFLQNEKNIKESLIVICGDIIHEKDKITPELILLLREFLKNLSNITDVILFSGNHDLIENNLERVPNLEALTQDIPNINYLKYSGVYEFENIVLSLNSLEDNLGFVSIPQEVNKIKIGLYHGMLKEIAFSNGLLSVDDFKEFDYTLLGDVHERQFLKDNIAYCGSLIQQNFGEDIDNHGLIKWDLINKTPECIDIQNDYGYITIRDIDNIRDSSNPISYPKNCRLRINLTNNDDIQKVQEIVATKTNIISEKIIKFKNALQKITYDEQFVKNINDEIIIKDKMTGQSEEKIHDILKLHNEIKDECDFNTKDISEYKWSILNIEFMNLFIYGDNKINKIDFTNTEGVIGILGNNAIGKSSIINIIIFALFDKITSEYNNTNVINKNSKKMYVKIEFMIGNTVYIIDKKGSLQKSNKTVKTKYETNYKKIEKDIEINLNGKDRIRTKQIIEETIGAQDIFLLCNIVSNTLSYSLLNTSNVESIKKFSYLFNLDKYDDLSKNVSKKIKLLTDKFNIEKGKLSTYESFENSCVDNLKSQLDDKIESKNIFTLELKEHTTNINKLNKKTKDISKQIILLKKPLESLEKLELEKEQLNKLIKIHPESTMEELYSQIYSVKESNLDKLKSEFKEYQKCQEHIEYQVFTEKFTDKHLYKQQNKLNNVNNKLKELEKELSEIIKDVKDLDEINDPFEVMELPERHVLVNKLIDSKEILKRKELIKDIYDIEKIENNIKENDDILFHNSDFIAKESKELQKELSKYAFFKNDVYKPAETRLFLNRINIFLSHIKTEDELTQIKNENDKAKKELQKGLKIKKLNDEIITFNKIIDDNIIFNEKIKIDNEKIKLDIIKIKYFECNQLIEYNKSEYTFFVNNIKEITEMIRYFYLKDIIMKMESNLDSKYKIEQLKHNNRLKEITENIDMCIKYNQHNEENDRLIKYKSKLDRKIEIIRNYISESNQNIIKLETEITYDSNKIKETENIIMKHKACKSELDDIKDTLSIYEMYKTLVDKKCIPSILLKEKLKFIENDINIHLDGLVSFKIEMYMDETSKFTLNIIKNDNILKAYMCSGYERFILNIMMKNSLNRYSYNNKSNIFCIDEGLDCIDDNNLKKFKIVLERLRNTYNHILLISQIDRIDKYIDHQILIEHKNNCSYII